MTIWLIERYACEGKPDLIVRRRGGKPPFRIIEDPPWFDGPSARFEVEWHPGEPVRWLRRVDQSRLLGPSS